MLTTANKHKKPVANNDSLITDIDMPATVNVLNNDSGLEDAPITLMITSPPLRGNVTIELNNSVTYTPNAGHFGVDNFAYSITDADNDSAIANVEINVVCASGNCSQTIRISWDANSEPDLSGYYLYHGTQPGVYTDKIWLGNVASYDLEIPDLTDHFFAISAEDTAGNESARSAEVSILMAQ